MRMQTYLQGWSHKHIALNPSSLITQACPCRLQTHASRLSFLSPFYHCRFHFSLKIKDHFFKYFFFNKSFIIPVFPVCFHRNAIQIITFVSLLIIIYNIPKKSNNLFSSENTNRTPNNVTGILSNLNVLGNQ